MIDIVPIAMKFFERLLLDKDLTVEDVKVLWRGRVTHVRATFSDGTATMVKGEIEAEDVAVVASHARSLVIETCERVRTSYADARTKHNAQTV